MPGPYRNTTARSRSRLSYDDLRSVRTAPTSASGVNGFLRKGIPVGKSEPPNPDKASTFSPGWRAESSRISGGCSSTSRRSIAPRCCSQSRSALSVFRACRTAYPALSRISRRSCRTCGSCSITRTVAIAGRGMGAIHAGRAGRLAYFAMCVSTYSKAAKKPQAVAAGVDRNRQLPPPASPAGERAGGPQPGSAKEIPYG